MLAVMAKVTSDRVKMPGGTLEEATGGLWRKFPTYELLDMFLDMDSYRQRKAAEKAGRGLRRRAGGHREEMAHCGEFREG